MLPDLPFTDIMLMVGLKNIEYLHRCRQVCKNWNEKIMSNIWESPSRKNIMKARIETVWSQERIFLSGEEISHTRWLGKIYLFV